MFKLLCIKCPKYVHYRNVFTSKCFCQNYYEVLKLPRSCTPKEIRNSFLNLSKEYHPDRNRDENTHLKFVKISEAYKVLSNPSSRQSYDLGLYNPPGNAVQYTHQGTWMDETLWQHHDKSQDKYYESKPYYGIDGMDRLPNSSIVFLCIIIGLIGVGLQIFLIRNSTTLKRDTIEKKSLELEELHSNIRAQALLNGDEKQLELLKKKLNYKSS